MMLPDIPRSWLVALFLFSMVVLRALSIDSYTTAGLAVVAGYIFGRDIGFLKANQGMAVPESSQ